MLCPQCGFPKEKASRFYCDKCANKLKRAGIIGSPRPENWPNAERDKNAWRGYGR